MNRKERRKCGAEKPKSYTMTEDEIKKIKRQACDEAIQTALILMMGLPCLTLIDKFNFNREQLSRLMDGVMLWYESVQNGEVTLEEIVTVVEEESGYSVIMR